MELERALETLRGQGLGVVAISYDAPEVIRHYDQRAGGLSYPLLADPDSEIIRAFGVLNPNFEEGTSGYGMAFPGTFVVDADGIVTAKFFEQMHRQRYTAETVLLETFGVGGGRRLELEAEHLRAAAYASQDVVRPGNRILLSVEIELAEGMHLYAPGADPYRPLTLTVTASPMLEVGDTSLPQPEILYLEPIDQRVPVFRRTVTLRREVTLSPRYREQTIRVETLLRYQVCSETICYPPAEQPLVFALEVEAHDTERVPEALQRRAGG